MSILGNLSSQERRALTSASRVIVEVERDLTPLEAEAVRHLKRAARAAAMALVAFRREHPEGNIYMAMESWNLMTGSSHDGSGERPRQDRIVASVNVLGTGGGDW